jgi:2'-5' RNA ligase
MSARRLFFALWPDAAMREALFAATRDAVRSTQGGRSVPVENLHLTLAFLGAVPEPALAGLRQLARDVSTRASTPGGPAAAPLDATLDTIDYWRRARLLCATAAREPPRAAAFALALIGALAAAGFRPDLKPFRAHVTLARQVRDAPRTASMAPVVWTFDALALIESRTAAEGSSYSIVESWALCG